MVWNITKIGIYRNGCNLLQLSQEQAEKMQCNPEIVRIVYESMRNVSMRRGLIDLNETLETNRAKVNQDFVNDLSREVAKKCGEEPKTSAQKELLLALVEVIKSKRERYSEEELKKMDEHVKKIEEQERESQIMFLYYHGCNMLQLSQEQAEKMQSNPEIVNIVYGSLGYVAKKRGLIDFSVSPASQSSKFNQDFGIDLVREVIQCCHKEPQTDGKNELISALLDVVKAQKNNYTGKQREMLEKGLKKIEKMKKKESEPIVHFKGKRMSYSDFIKSPRRDCIMSKISENEFIAFEQDSLLDEARSVSNDLFNSSESSSSDSNELKKVNDIIAKLESEWKSQSKDLNDDEPVMGPTPRHLIDQLTQALMDKMGIKEEDLKVTVVEELDSAKEKKKERNRKTRQNKKDKKKAAKMGSDEKKEEDKVHVDVVNEETNAYL